MTHFDSSFAYGFFSTSVRGPTSVGHFAWEMRTVERMKKGTSNRSDRSYASRVKARASALSAGSSRGMCAAIA